MKSPFPGMDPYIEASGLWEGFHNHLIANIAETFADAVPERYVVRIGVRSYLLPIEEEHREAFIEIYELGLKKRLVTSLEVLSPSNKHPGTPGWDLYGRKRQKHLLTDVNFVEIDLVRGGQRMPMFDSWPDSPYTLLVARAKKPNRCEIWPVHFQRPLPVIPVPLAQPDPDMTLNLQPLIETIYQLFRYERSIDYTGPLTPPLCAADAAWLKEQLRERTGKA